MFNKLDAKIAVLIFILIKKMTNRINDNQKTHHNIDKCGDSSILLPQN
jgi:hypothetical protein